ncbi:MAG: MBL fold metallo-hydrolase [Spirochaetota bacterium]
MTNTQIATSPAGVASDGAQAGGRIIVLMENRSESPDLASEHGLSLWIETPECAVLFDTGQSPAFASNARKLGVDLGSATAIVLSHGHYDHAGGLEHALSATTAPLYLGENATVPKRARGEAGMRDIGMDASLAKRYSERVRAVSSRREILPGIEVLPAAPLETRPPSDNERLLRETSDGLDRDPFEDELSLLVHAPDQDVLVTGCSHRGIVNIYRQAGRPPIVVGGLHLSHEPDGRVREVAEQLADAAELWVGHCTGDRAVEILAEELPGKVRPIRVGTALPL